MSYARGPRVAPREGASPPDWRGAVSQAAIAVAVTRVVFLGVGSVSAWLLADTRGPLVESFADVWVHWDARHFLEIATFGYTDPATDPNAAAFFPLYPLLIRALDGLGVPPVVAAMAIATAATWVACTFLYLLAEDHERGAGRAAMLFLLVFPTAVFLIAPYSEALFLAGAIGAFYFARRGEPARAVLPAAVALGTRAAGALVLVGLVVEFVRRRVPPRRWIGALAVAAIPAVAFFAYLAAVDGGLAYLDAQRAGWGRDFVGPLASFAKTWELATQEGAPASWIMAWRVELVAAVGGVAATAWALAQREWGYAAYMGTTMAALLTSTWYFSVPRMLLGLFPIFVLAARTTAGRPARRETVLLISAPMAVLGVIVYTQGAWFF